jgi:isocitrate/isopropylmalate dehydrogenase
MLHHLGEGDRAGRVASALRAVLASGHVTPDLGGPATTTSFADAICREIER